MEILCNIDDYCILFIFICGWYIFKSTGVDLNLQYPAKWDCAKQIKSQNGIHSFAPRDFVGDYPISEPESYAIYSLTLRNHFDLIITLHSQGEVIYWKYDNFNPKFSFDIGQLLSASSGYLLDLTPPESSYAGYKDWFISFYNKPGYTIEVGLGENPLPLSDFDSIYVNIRNMFFSFCNEKLLGFLS